MDTTDTDRHHLRTRRETVRWKVDGLDELDLRLPRTPTGTNLLGLVKHLAGCEVEYFGECLGRAFPETPAALAEASEDNADMWATDEECAADVLAPYRRATDFADEGIAALSAED